MVECIGRFFSENSRLGSWGSVASIFSIPLAIALWVWPVLPERELTYSIQPSRSAIIQSNQPADLHVSYKGVGITGDLTAAQVAIENTGKEPIRSNDVIKSLWLVLTNTQILDAHISTPALDGTQFRINTNAMASGRIGVDFTILEKGDRPVVGIIYAGNISQPIALEGRVVGQPHPKKTDWPARKGNWHIVFIVLRWVTTAVGIVVVAVALRSLTGTKEKGHSG